MTLINRHSQDYGCSATHSEMSRLITAHRQRFLITYVTWSEKKIQTDVNQRFDLFKASSGRSSQNLDPGHHLQGRK